MGFFKKAALYLGTFCLLFSSCEKEPFEKTNKLEPQEILSDKVEILSSQNLQTITNYSPNTITFSQAQNFSQGDFIVGGTSEKTPQGLLKKVSSISSDKKTISTINIPIEEALLKGEINYNKKLTMSDVPSGSKLKSSKAGFTFNYEVDAVIYDKDGDLSTTYDQAKIIGDIDFDAEFYIQPKFNRGLEKISFGTEIEGNANLNLISTGMFDINKEITFYTQKFNPITILGPLGFPIVLSPEIDLNLGLEGNFLGHLETGIVFDINSSSDLTYQNKNWTKTESLDKTFSPKEPIAYANSEIKAYGGPKLKIMVYELVGPSVSVYDYLKLNVNTNSTPWWTLSAGIEGNIGINMGPFSKKTGNFEKTIFNLEEIVAQSQGPTNTLPSAYFIVNPYSGDVNTEFSFNASGTYDKETSLQNLLYRWDFEGDGNWDTQFTKGLYQLKHKYSQTGSYLPKLEVKDEGGLVDDALYSILVEGNLDSLIIQPGPEGKDSYIVRILNSDCSGSYGTYGNSSELEIEYQDFSDCREVNYEAFIQFPLNSIPENAEIVSAKMELYGSSWMNLIGQNPRFSFYKLLGNWGEESISWQNKPEDELILSQEMIQSSSGRKWYSVDITSTLNNWMGGEQNYGIHMKSDYDDSGGIFYSSDHSEVDKRPKLKIYYKK